jgi:hypothetical protein
VAKTLLLLLLKFVAITAPLTWVWMNGGQQAYFKFFMSMARPLLVFMGVMGMSQSLVRDRMFNVIPFLALMLITPRLPPLKRVRGIVLGYGIIFLSQVGLCYWAYATHIRDGRTAESMSNFFPALIACDAIPFVLWAIFANEFLSDLLRQVLPASAMPQSKSRPASAPPAPPVDDAVVPERES